MIPLISIAIEFKKRRKQEISNIIFLPKVYPLCNILMIIELENKQNIIVKKEGTNIDASLNSPEDKFFPYFLDL